MQFRVRQAVAAGGIAAALAVGGVVAGHQGLISAAYAQTATSTSTTASGSTSARTGSAKTPDAALKSVLDQLVGQGKLSSTQESDVLTAWQQYLQQHPRPERGPGFPGFGLGADSQTVATALKLTPQQLQQQVRSGKSIAQIAQAQNVPLQTVEDAIANAAKTRLDQQVAAGKLTSAQETQFLNGLKSRLPQLVNATPGQFPGPGHPGRPFGQGPRPTPTPGA